MTRSIVVLAALALLLTGCAEQYPASPPAEHAEGPAMAVPTAMPTAQSTPSPTPTPAATATAKGATTVTLTQLQGKPPAGVGVGPQWYVLKAAPGSSSVEIAWNDMTSPSCGGAEAAYVQESTTAVLIDLVRHAPRPGAVCPMVLAPHRTTITLSAPLGSRQLLEAPPTSGSPSASATVAPKAG